MRAGAIVALVTMTIAALAARADKVVLVAGGGVGRDGAPATRAQLKSPFGVAHDAAGRLLIVEHAHALRAIDPAGRIMTAAGDGTKGDNGDNGLATAARFNAPHALAVGADDTIYVADTLNHRVRAIDPKTN